MRVREGQGPTILVVDDQESERFLLEIRLGKLGFQTLSAAGPLAALELLDTSEVDLILSDLVMPEMDGLELLRRVRARHGAIPFVLITAHGEIDSAVASIKQGADDYILKPVAGAELKAVIEKSLSYRRLSEENARLKDRLRELYSFQNIVTAAPAMQRVLKEARKVAASPQTTVAIYGESGVGKEVLARAIHYGGEKLAHNFVAVNCAGVPPSLLESELFGHVRGAFTGAERGRSGKFDQARGGTLLLDEIGDMPLELQAKLLRVLEQRCYQPLGSNREIPADFRVITATHRNLAELVRRGLFREDIYHRINAFPLSLPPLRERSEDIPLLAENFLTRHGKEAGGRPLELSRAALAALVCHSWPGNVRELKNRIERAVILAEGAQLTPADLGLATPDLAAAGKDGEELGRYLAAAGEEREESGRYLAVAGKERGESERLPVAAPDGAGTIAADRGRVTLTIDLPTTEFSLAAAVDQVVEYALERCGGNKAKAVALLRVGRNFLYRQPQRRAGGRRPPELDPRNGADEGQKT